MRQKSFPCLRYDGLKVGGRPGTYFGLKVPVHGRGSLGEFTVALWRTDPSAPAASLGRWDEISAVGAGLTAPYTEHPGDGVCLAVVSEGCFNV